MRSSSHFISIHKTLPSSVNTAGSHNTQSIPGTLPPSQPALQPTQVHPVHVHAHAHAIHLYNDY